MGGSNSKTSVQQQSVNQQQQQYDAQQQNIQQQSQQQQQQQQAALMFQQQQIYYQQQQQAYQQQQQQQQQQQMQQSVNQNQAPPSMPPSQNPQNQQQFQQMYRTWRQSIHVKQGQNQQQKKDGNEDLKNFYLKAAIDKESIKTSMDGTTLSIMFKLDASCDAHIRVNVCVTEKKNANNAPEMFYTPNRESYIQQMSVSKGMGQEIQAGMITFDMNYLTAFELTKSMKDYHPMIISINYQDEGKQYAMLTYVVFQRDGNQNINGCHVDKQVVLINGIPFEIKSIYGLVSDSDAQEGEQAIIDDDAEKECLVCLSDPKDTLIMPCGHLCVCSECGKGLVNAKQTCPICRGAIQSLIPMKSH